MTEDQFDRISAEQAGYDETRLTELSGYLEESDASAMLMLYKGDVFFEYADIHEKIFVHSIRKALLSSVIGIHHGRVELNLDATLADLRIERPDVELSELGKTAKLSDVLKFRSGVYLPATAETERMAASRPTKGSHLPSEA